MTIEKYEKAILESIYKMTGISQDASKEQGRTSSKAECILRSKYYLERYLRRGRNKKEEK
jgi:hypothetical protein